LNEKIPVGDYLKVKPHAALLGRIIIRPSNNKLKWPKTDVIHLLFHQRKAVGQFLLQNSLNFLGFRA
jgi:hypothetical protein